MNIYDTVIIGAGMSGLAAGIRLAMFDQKVCILERHNVPGGLNSYYERKGRKLDVGLHAMTNFACRGERGRPLTKLLKQLRIPYEKLELSQQNFSKISFPGNCISFSNAPQLLIAEIERDFPQQKDNFARLIELVKDFDDVNLNNKQQSAKKKVRGIISDEHLLEMIFCPLLIYGSAWENDMDFSQFVIMFKSIYLEGFSRPKNGVRTVINLLLEKFKQLGGELRLGTGVKTINVENGSVTGVTLDSGEKIQSTKILSSIGLPETMNIVSGGSESTAIGSMSFTETILFFDKKPGDNGIKETIIFCNDNDKYDYKQPQTLCDYRSAVICFPNNFGCDDYEEGIIRVTFIANFEKWNELDRKTYLKSKQEVYNEAMTLITRLFPDFQANLLYHDVFTPMTIMRYTGHFKGAVYGSTQKARDGRTGIKNLFICGTDQGFLGIVGAMLSGISMANLHCLMNGEKA
ncbi:phytoene dehydrogenase-like [hydrocarbon metagenome]|uniref:Phytoene dehydrogenase-like n=1 Tax=hydrocarbon metagenome TaxID=938273 RepID=A0A0W8FNK4_9ZZZZ